MKTEEKNDKKQILFKFGITSQPTEKRKSSIKSKREIDYQIVYDTQETENGFFVKLLENTILFTIGKLHGKKHFSFLCENHFYSSQPEEKIIEMFEKIRAKTMDFSKEILDIIKDYSED